MRVAMFCHSVLSDWNHGCAHFLRGVASELVRRGHLVSVYEPADAWSVEQLVAHHGDGALARTRRAYPLLDPVRYQASTLNLDKALADVDLVLVHERNSPSLIAAIGAHRARSSHYRLLFHDTGYRSITDPSASEAHDLTQYDGVLASASSIRDRYVPRARATWVWHEAADTHVFRPLLGHDEPQRRDLVWIGNWSDDERARALKDYLIDPVARLQLAADVYGVCYPPSARQSMSDVGLTCHGWLPNFEVPRVLSKYQLTVHLPRRQRAKAPEGPPTIRVFEALACGIPLVCGPWEDTDALFVAGRDYLLARNPVEMEAQITYLLHEPELRVELAARGRKTIMRRHTCAHRVKELLAICAKLGVRDESARA